MGGKLSEPGHPPAEASRGRTSGRRDRGRPDRKDEQGGFFHLLKLDALMFTPEKFRDGLDTGLSAANARIHRDAVLPRHSLIVRRAVQCRKHSRGGRGSAPDLVPPRW